MQVQSLRILLEVECVPLTAAEGKQIPHLLERLHSYLHARVLPTYVLAALPNAFLGLFSIKFSPVCV